MVRDSKPGIPLMFKLAFLGVLGFVALMVVIAGFSSFTGYANQGFNMVTYNGGPLDNNNYRDYRVGGTGRFYKGIFTKTYEYPTTNRTYIVSKTVHEGDVKAVDAMTAKCGDSNEVQVESALTFQLVADQESLRKFHETYGLKFQAWTGDGWAEFLTQMVRQPIKESLQRELKPYTAISAMGQSTDASGTTTGMMAVGLAVQEDIQRQLDIYMGGHYIEVVSFQINDITPTNGEITAAIARRSAAQQDVETAKQHAKAAEFTANANGIIRQSLKGDGGMAAVYMEAIKNNKITFWVLPDKGNLTITGPSK